MKYLICLGLATYASALTVSFDSIINAGDWKTLLTYQSAYAQLSNEQKSEYVKLARAAVIAVQVQFIKEEPTKSDKRHDLGVGLVGLGVVGLFIEAAIFIGDSHKSRLRAVGFSAGAIAFTVPLLLGLYSVFNLSVKINPNGHVNPYADALLVREIITTWSIQKE